MPLVDQHTFIAELDKLYTSASFATDVRTVEGDKAKSAKRRNVSSDGKAAKSAVNSGRGTVWVTMKRHYPSLQRAPRKRRRTAIDDSPSELRPVCLVRATDGKRKISCHVSTNDVPRFSERLGSLLTSSVGEAVTEGKVRVEERGGQRRTEAAGTATATPSAAAETVTGPGGGGGGGGGGGATPSPSAAAVKKKSGDIKGVVVSNEGDKVMSGDGTGVMQSDVLMGDSKTTKNKKKKSKSKTLSDTKTSDN